MNFNCAFKKNGRRATLPDLSLVLTCLFTFSLDKFEFYQSTAIKFQVRKGCSASANLNQPALNSR